MYHRRLHVHVLLLFSLTVSNAVSMQFLVVLDLSNVEISREVLIEYTLNYTSSLHQAYSEWNVTSPPTITGESPAILLPI